MRLSAEIANLCNGLGIALEPAHESPDLEKGLASPISEQFSQSHFSPRTSDEQELWECLDAKLTQHGTRLRPLTWPPH